jgi:hypothetical protein
LALADIAPASKTGATELSKAKSSNSEDDWIFSIRLAAEIASPGNSHIFGSDPDLQIRNNLASAALLDAVKGGYRFRLFRSFNVRGNYAYSLNVSAPMQEHTFYGVPSSTIRNVALITKVLQDAGTDQALLLKTVRAFCLDINGQCRGVVQVNVGEQSEIKLIGGTSVKKADAPAGVTLRPETSKQDARILVSWTSPDGTAKAGVLDSISGINDCGFSPFFTSLLRE